MSKLSIGAGRLMGVLAGLGFTLLLTGAANAKPVEYVKVCSLYGAGFYYLPGSDTCVKIGGWVRQDGGGRVCSGQYFTAGPSCTRGPDAVDVTKCTYGGVHGYVPAGSYCPQPATSSIANTGGASSAIRLYVGGDLAFGTTWNTYDDFPAFSSSGIGAGGHVGLRYYFRPNAFVGGEAGWIGTNIRGTNPDGAFVNYDWQAWQMGLLGVTFTPPQFPTPISVYVGAGATQGRITVGVDFSDFHESMSDVMTGTVARIGFEIPVRPNITLGASYQHSWFDGSIDGDPVKTQINTALLSVNYAFSPAF